MENNESIAVILEMAKPELLNEIRYRVYDIEHDDPYDEVDGFDDTAQMLRQTKGVDKSLLINILDIEIKLLRYRVQNPNEAAITRINQKSQVVKNWDIQHRGIKYMLN